MLSLSLKGRAARNSSVTADIKKLRLHALASLSIAGIFALFITDSIPIAFFFGLLASMLPMVISSRRRERTITRLEMLWPEILDLLISGVQSGLSIAQTLSSLARRGPNETKLLFGECENKMKEGSDIRAIFPIVKKYFENSTCDQVCEVLELSISSGSREISTTLRALSTQVRSNLAVKEEIRAKQEWIRNSAVLAAIAPWLLLLLLSSQASTRQAYSQTEGIIVLTIGALSTVAAYFWMKSVGKLPSAPRVFP